MTQAAKAMASGVMVPTAAAAGLPLLRNIPYIHVIIMDPPCGCPITHTVSFQEREVRCARSLHPMRLGTPVHALMCIRDGTAKGALNALVGA